MPAARTVPTTRYGGIAVGMLACGPRDTRQLPKSEDVLTVGGSGHP